MHKIIPIVFLILVSCGSTGGSSSESGRVERGPVTTTAKRGSVNLNYHLSIANPANHDIEVSILVEDHNDTNIDFVMPTWAPGRLVRDDYAALVSEVSARGRGAKTLRMTRIGANRWRVAAGGEDLVFKYRVHAARLSNGSSLLNDQGGIINPASVCMYLEGRRAQPLGVYVGMPESLNWSSYSGMDAGDGAGRFTADSYGELIHSPILLGRYSEHKVAYGDQVARVYVSPRGSSYSTQVADGVREILKNSLAWFGTPQKKRDLFLGFAFGLGRLNEMEGAGSGNICVGIGDSLGERSIKKALLGAASLVSQARLHEPLQLADWNTVDFDHLLVDSMAWLPRSMGRYFGHHLMQRCGLTSDFGLRSAFAQTINKVESEPSKRRLSLATAAENLALMRDMSTSFLPTNQNNQFFNAWDRGLITMLLMDLTVIGDSDGERDIAGLVEYFERNGGPLTQRTFLNACNEVGGSSLKNLADRLINDTRPRPYDEVAEAAGFVIQADVGNRSQLGASLNGTRVVSVARNTSASRAGLQAGDQISRFAGKDVTTDINREIAAFPAGTATTITVVRRGSLVTLPIELTEIRRGGFRFEDAAGGKKATRARFYGNAITP